MFRLKQAFIVLVFLSSVIFVQAQDFDRPNGFGGSVLFIDHASFQDDDISELGGITTGFEFSYSRHFNKAFSLRVPFKGGIISTGDQEFARNRSFIGMDVTLQATYFGDDNLLAPFAYAGFGGTKEEGLDLYTQIPVGAGVNLRIGQWGFFQVKAEYRADLNNDLPRKNMQYGFGLAAVVGPTKTTQEIEKMLSDTDGDGIDDDKDRCPDVAGRKQFGGCLDADNDGIGDADDSCPDDFGLKTLNGCPDADADGVADIVDNCPNIAGTADGCPDADGDGVADAVDKCPNEAGPYNGCVDMPEGETSEEVALSAENGINTSEEEIVLGATEGMEAIDDMTAKGGLSIEKDLDNDGFSDKEDDCPNASGPANGCPDSDGDGVADRFDACPNSTGDLAGCPDGDNDGIADYKDSCPTRKGSATNNGCPEITNYPGSNSTVYSTPNSTSYNDYNTDTRNYRSTNLVPESALTLMEYATKTVQFQVLSDNLTNDSYDVLGQVVDLLNSNPNYRLKVSGHTDDRGEDSVNQRLSEKRARACIRYLRDQGVTETQMSYMGYGARIPVSDNDSDYGRRQNRRVDFELFIAN